MYYTVSDARSGRQCISIATSITPGGPYVDDSSGPFICQLDHGGSIDPAPFVAPGGTPYLVWKSDDNAINNPTSLWAQQLSADGHPLVGAPARLLTEDHPWQLPAVEGPSMIAVSGSYYLFYGASRWDTANAAIGYATCSSPLGGCVDASATPWMASHGAAVGPGGPVLFVDRAGVTRIAYHAWTGGVGYRNGGVRSLWIDAVSFASGRPVLR
jgi:beta-xylosidase